MDLAPLRKGNNKEDIVARFRAMKTSDEEKNRKIEKAKDVMDKTLAAVEHLGQIAASGASLVAGSPANITMNCISTLIDFRIQYKDIAHNIDDLFEKIATTMERFQNYQEHEHFLGPPMTRVALRMLTSIVKICRLCYVKLQENKLRKFLKVALFSDDGAIKEQLKILSDLENEELQMKATSTLVNTAKTNELVRKIDLQNTRTASDMGEQRILQELKEKLGVKDSTSKEEYQWYCDRMSTESCSWLKRDDIYASWSDPNNHTASLLLLQGDEGCGKSYALSAIVRDLFARYPQNKDANTRIVVSYCYPTKDGQKNAQKTQSDQNPKSAHSIRDALREWSWQAINMNISYRRKIQASIESNSDLGDLNTMWHKLFLDQLDDGINYFLFLDGTHELDDEGVIDLSEILQILAKKSPSPGRLKLAVTLRPILKRKLAVRIALRDSIINLQERNQADVESFIHLKVDRLTMFQKNSKHVQDLKEEVCKGLLDAVDGSFSLAALKLQEISTKYDREEILKLVRNVNGGASLTDSVADIIRDYDRTLTTREIETLNTLLLWVMYSPYVSVADLEAVLFVQHNQDMLQLAQEIRSKFSLVFDVTSYGQVKLKYDSIKDYFEQAAASSNAMKNEHPNHLTKGEIRMVRNFILKLCEEDIYRRLGLEEFFDQKISQSGTGVTVDCDNAHPQIALICLQVITEISTERTSPLEKYGAKKLGHHLTKIDLDKVDPRLKAELGPPLVKSFRDPDSIRRYQRNAFSGWSFMDEDLNTVIRLLRSSALTSKLDAMGSSNKEWAEMVLRDPHPELAILRDSAMYFAKSWLSEENPSEIMRGFHWLLGYSNKMQNIKDPTVRRVKKTIFVTRIRIEDVGHVIRMIQDLQPFDLDDAQILYKTAVAYQDYGFFSQAIQHLRRALDAEPTYLYAQAAIAECYACRRFTDTRPDWENALYYQDISHSTCKGR